MIALFDYQMGGQPACHCCYTASEASASASTRCPPGDSNSAIQRVDIESEASEVHMAASISHSIYDKRPPGFEPAHRANADTGASGAYLATRDKKYLQNVKACTPSTQIVVQVANDQTIISSHEGELHVPDGSVLKAYIFPEISGSLLSISQFVDIGFTVAYDYDGVSFTKNKTTVFTGDRDPMSRLWMVDLAIFSNSLAPRLPAPPASISPNLPVSSVTAAPAVRLQSKEEHVRYWHACFGFPPKASFISAVKSWLNVPGLVVDDVKRYLPNIVYTALGHLDATRKNIASTRATVANSPYDPSPPAIWISVKEITGRVHLDATGALPFKGRDGSQYLLIFYSEDKNYIHVVRMKSRSAKDYTKAIQSAMAFFKLHRVNTSIIRMDNECSELVKEHIRAATLSLELTPASQHRRNKAERAIRSFKNHFIASMAGVDVSSAADLWSDYTAQIEETLNLLRRGRSGKSSWEDLFGPRDFNAVPLAPIGIKVVAHVPPSERASWAQHGLIGYYIGPAHEHYRCYRIWIPATKAIRVSDCCEWYPADILSASMDEKLAALPLLPPPSNLQRVETPPMEKGREQRVAPNPAAPTVPAPNLFPANTTANKPVQLQHNQVPANTIASKPVQLQHNELPANTTATKPVQLQHNQVPANTIASKPVQLQHNELPANTIANKPVQSQQTNQHPADITATDPVQLQHNKRRRSPGYYRALTPAELNKLPREIFRKIGQQFIDNEDPDDSTSGIVADVVKHTKSKKLHFKVYDDKLFTDGPPSDKMDFSYLVVSWAIKACRFHKAKKSISHLAALAQVIHAEQLLYNFGTTSSARRKQRRQRQRPRLEWYQKLPLRANSAIEQHANITTASLFEALSSIDLCADGSRLTATSALNGPERDEWLAKFAEEIMRLITSGTGTFVRRSEVPAGKSVAYANPQLKIKMKNGKLEKRVRMTIGGDQLPYAGPTAAQTAALEVIRLLLNALVSEGANLMTLDIKDFYLGTPMDEPEYMRIPLKFIPLDLQIQYNLKSMQSHDAVVMKIEKSIYGLKQSSILSQQRLVEHLASHE
jgi:hypothetical protein